MNARGLSENGPRTQRSCWIWLSTCLYIDKDRYREIEAILTAGRHPKPLIGQRCPICCRTRPTGPSKPTKDRRRRDKRQGEKILRLNADHKRSDLCVWPGPSDRETNRFVNQNANYYNAAPCRDNIRGHNPFIGTSNHSIVAASHTPFPTPCARSWRDRTRHRRAPALQWIGGENLLRLLPAVNPCEPAQRERTKWSALGLSVLHTKKIMMSSHDRTVIRHAVDEIGFGFLSDEDIKKLSVKRITSPVTFDTLNNPLPG